MAIEDGLTVPSVDEDGHQEVVVEPTPGSEKYFFSPNLTDETSWYEGSTQVTEQALTDSGDQTTYTSGQENWVDLKHGKVLGEASIIVANPAYAVKVEVQVGGTGDWIEKTENTWGKTDGDYTVDYAVGSVTFNSAIGASDNVRASYYYAGTFIFTVAPGAGKRLKVNYVEVQFTQDIEQTGDAIFQIWVYNPSPPPTKIPYKELRYRDLFNYYTESTGPFPVLPQVGTRVVESVTGITNIQTKVRDGYRIVGTHYDTDWNALMVGIDPTEERSCRQKVVTIPFKYLAYRDLRASQGAEIRVSLENGKFGGTKATFTFYCLTEDE